VKAAVPVALALMLLQALAEWAYSWFDSPEAIPASSHEEAVL